MKNNWKAKSMTVVLFLIIYNSFRSCQVVYFSKKKQFMPKKGESDSYHWKVYIWKRIQIITDLWILLSFSFCFLVLTLIKLVFLILIFYKKYTIFASSYLSDQSWINKLNILWKHFSSYCFEIQNLNFEKWHVNFPCINCYPMVNFQSYQVWL